LAKQSHGVAIAFGETFPEVQFLDLSVEYLSILVQQLVPSRLDVSHGCLRAVTESGFVGLQPPRRGRPERQYRRLPAYIWPVHARSFSRRLVSAV
jgi:hypothetical protein